MDSVSKTGSFIRPADTTQYAVGDVMAAVTTALTLPFLGLNKFTGGGCLLQSAVAISSACQATKPAIDLLLFSADITDIDADNATFTPTDAQLLTFVGKVSFAAASWTGGDLTSGTGGNAYAQAASIGMHIKADAIYGVAVAANTYTPIASEVFTFRLNFIRDYGRDA